MEDPLPENIEGSKRVVHKVNHEIHWGHALLGAAVIVLVLSFGPPLLGGSDDEEGY